MNKTALAALLVGLAGFTVAIVATAEMRKLTTTVNDLETRLAALDHGNGAPATPEGGKTSTSDPAKSPATLAEVNSEIVKLRKEMAEVKSAQESPVASPTTVAKTDKPPVTGTPAVPVPEELRKAVDQVLAEREEAAKKEEAKRAEDFQARRTQEFVNGLAEQLGMTEQQKTQVTDIVTKESAAMRDLWTNRKDGDDTRAKTEELRKSRDVAIKAVLSAEQVAKYDEVARSLQRGPGGGGRGGRGGGGQGGGGFGGGN